MLGRLNHSDPTFINRASVLKILPKVMYHNLCHRIEKQGIRSQRVGEKVHQIVPASSRSTSAVVVPDERIAMAGVTVIGSPDPLCTPVSDTDFCSANSASVVTTSHGSLSSSDDDS